MQTICHCQWHFSSIVQAGGLGLPDDEVFVGREQSEDEGVREVDSWVCEGDDLGFFGEDELEWGGEFCGVEWEQDCGGNKEHNEKGKVVIFLIRMLVYLMLKIK